VTERETAGRLGDGVADAVQATAYLAAACRAREAARAQPRLTDPYAARFASLADQPALHRLASSAGEEVVARTVLLDRLLGSALSQWEQPLVVNLGAGFCTRPYRLDLSACRLVLEVDAAPVLAVKERVLAEEKASCPVIRSPGDVTRLPELVDLLAAHGAGDGPTVVLTEGLLPYLPEAAVTQLAEALAGALPEAIWLADVVSTSSAAGMAQLARTAGAAVPLYGLDSLAGCEAHGWQVVDYRILPVARRGPLGVPGRGGGPVSSQVVDGVVALRHPRAPR